MMLRGKVFISTVSSENSQRMRSAFGPSGAVLVDFPVISIHTAELTPEINKVINELEKFHWIIFTSKNGVIHFNKLLARAGIKSGIPQNIRIAVTGDKTAEEIEKIGLKVEFTGTGTSEDLANGLLGKRLVENCNILMPLGNLANEIVQTHLSEVARVTRINVYKTVKKELTDLRIPAMIKNNACDLVLFTSPSAIYNFIDIIGLENIGSGLHVASIGKITESAAIEKGLNCVVTAKKPTYEDLADEIIQYYNLKK